MTTPVPRFESTKFSKPRFRLRKIREAGAQAGLLFPVYLIPCCAPVRNVRFAYLTSPHERSKFLNPHDSYRSTFPPDSGTDECSGSSSSSDRPSRHRPSRTGVCEAGKGASGKYSSGFPDHGLSHYLSRLGQRRMGVGHREHAFSWRPRADVRDRPLLAALATGGGKIRPEC